MTIDPRNPGPMPTDQSDIVERLGDLARYYMMERPAVNQDATLPKLTEISQRECEELASEMSKAADEITRLRAALAAEREECARVAEQTWVNVTAERSRARIAAAIRARG